MKLSARNSESLQLPAKKTEHIYWDDDIAGFGLRLREGGSRNWIFQYRVGGKQRRISFGSASTLTAQKARQKAATLHAQVKLGDDPAGQKIEARVRATETLGHTLQPYLARKKAELKPRTYTETERHLLVNAKRLHGLQLANIDRRTVAALLTEIDAKSGAHTTNHLRAALSAFFTWAMREGLAEGNPVIGTNRAITNGARDRVLSDTELRAIWTALEDDDYSNVVRLLALTGQRRDEIGGLRWTEVDFDKAVIALPAERTKNKKPHDVPLSPAALAILRDYAQRAADRDCVFGRGAAGYQGYSKSKATLDHRIDGPIDDWRLHDLRRTVSTRMHDDLGVSPHIVEGVLNHISGHRAGVAGTYNRALYSKEKAAALARWAEHLSAIVSGARSKIVPIKGGAR